MKKYAWKYFPLSELIDKTRGICYGVVQPGVAVPSGVPLIRVNNITDGNVNKNELLIIDEKIDRKYQRSKLKGNEVLLTIVGRVGESAVVPPELKGVNVARAVAVIPVRDNVGSFWVHYCLRTTPIQHLIQTWCNTTVQSTLNLGDVERIPIPLPPIQTRSTIIRILKTFDDMVNNTLRKNQILEKIIQSIFKSWFIDFDGQTEFVDSELGEIPKGWDILELGDVTTIKGRIGWRGYTVDDLDDSGALVIGGKHIGKNNRLDLTDPTFISWEKYYESPEIQISVGNIIVTKNGNSVGRIALIDQNIGKSTINPNVVLLKESKISYFYLYYYLVNPYAQNYLISGSSGGSAQPTINNEILRKMKIIVPPQLLIDNFDKISKPMFNKMSENDAIVIKLTKIRRLILPKLMSGEIKV